MLNSCFGWICHDILCIYIYTNIFNPLDLWNKPREFLGSLMLWYVHQFQGIPMAIACWIVGNPTIPPISSEPVTQDFTFLEVKWLASWWLNQPQLKNMSQNGFIFPKLRGENSKNIWNHHLAWVENGWPHDESTNPSIRMWIIITSHRFIASTKTGDNSLM